MRLGRVCGNVVSTVKADGLTRYKLLLVRDVDAADPGAEGDGGVPYIAVDLVGSGEGEIVLVAHGSAARIDAGTGTIPTDAAIVAIVDSAQLDSRTTFIKR
jgi:ethanolamine utilization protein EutN